MCMEDVRLNRHKRYISGTQALVAFPGLQQVVARRAGRTALNVWFDNAGGIIAVPSTQATNVFSILFVSTASQGQFIATLEDFGSLLTDAFFVGTFGGAANVYFQDIWLDKE